MRHVAPEEQARQAAQGGAVWPAGKDGGQVATCTAEQAMLAGQACQALGRMEDIQRAQHAFPLRHEQDTGRRIGAMLAQQLQPHRNIKQQKKVKNVDIFNFEPENTLDYGRAWFTMAETGALISLFVVIGVLGALALLHYMLRAGSRLRWPKLSRSAADDQAPPPQGAAGLRRLMGRTGSRKQVVCSGG